jgi:hypothetical protein
MTTSHQAEAADPHEKLGRPTPPLVAQFLRTNHLLLIISFATVLVIGVIASLALNSWVLLLVALAVHALGTFLVTGFALRLTGYADKPDPVTAARLEAEGTPDAEEKLNRTSGGIGDTE